MDYSRAVVAALLSPQGQAAVAAGQTGTLVRLMRKARGGASRNSPTGRVTPRRRSLAWSGA